MPIETTQAMDNLNTTPEKVPPERKTSPKGGRMKFPPETVKWFLELRKLTKESDGPHYNHLHRYSFSFFNNVSNSTTLSLIYYVFESCLTVVTIDAENSTEAPMASNYAESGMEPSQPSTVIPSTETGDGDDSSDSDVNPQEDEHTITEVHAFQCSLPKQLEPSKFKFGNNFILIWICNVFIFILS